MHLTVTMYPPTNVSTPSDSNNVLIHKCLVEIISVTYITIDTFNLKTIYIKAIIYFYEREFPS